MDTDYFAEKRGEMGELSKLLASPALMRDQEQYREVIKKVVANMTMGVDMSELFGAMSMAAATTDLVRKKMVYLYLANYAEMNAELSILAINTLLKDCNDTDPLVRGMALRSLCSLRVEDIAEYLVKPLQNGIKDPSPYVRKTAVLGCLKLFHLSPPRIRDSGVVNRLYELLRDRDPDVVTNVVYTLNEMLSDEGGMAVNRNIIFFLLNRIRELPEWGQIAILELILKFTPSDDDERFSLMDLLDERLKHANSGVVLAAIRAFLHLIEGASELRDDVLVRVKDPLYSLMSTGTQELVHTVLQHTRMLVELNPSVFAKEYTFFLWRFHDHYYVRQAKSPILRDLATDATYMAIVGELTQFVTMHDEPSARLAVRTIGEIAVRVPAAAEYCLGQLLSFIDLEQDYITTQALIALKDLLRRYPACCEDVIPALKKVVGSLEDVEAKCALLWILGEYGSEIDASPYMLEEMVEQYESEPSAEVRLQMLTSALKLFFARAPECQPFLGMLLEKAVNDVTNQDVHDRALLYYRMLSSDVQLAKRVVMSSQGHAPERFFEDVDTRLKEKIFHEFNTLSVVFQQPSEEFMGKLPVPPFNVSDDANGGQEYADGFADDGDAGESSGDMLSPSSSSSQQHHPSTPSSSSHANDLLVDLMGSGVSSGPALRLNASVHLTPPEFQAKWGAAADSLEAHGSTPLGADKNAVIARLAQHSVRSLAVGGIAGGLKFYFFAQEASGPLFLVELLVYDADRSWHATIKTDSTAALTMFRDHLSRALA